MDWKTVFASLVVITFWLGMSAIIAAFIAVSLWGWPQ